MSTYGEQRYKENIKELTPEQKAKQTLILEAMKEQTAYERSQRRKLVKAAKDTVRGLISLLVIGMVAVMFFSCEAEETLVCDAVVGKSVFHNGVDREDTVDTHFFTLDNGTKVVVDLETYNSIQSIRGDKLYCR